MRNNCWVFCATNAFSEVKYIFIDEPELSLHPDWQRLLIPLLEYQGTEKQFFIASHSPYIGMKYEDNEFHLGQQGDFHEKTEDTGNY